MRYLLPLTVALAVAATPVAEAQSITKQFKTELAKKLGSKTGTAAAKAAANTIAKYVVAKPKGDPNKIKNFTQLANKSLKKLISKTDGKAFETYNKLWSSKVMFKYFKKGKIAYDPANKKFNQALSTMLKFLPPAARSNPSIIQTGFDELKKNNNKLKGTPDDLATLQREVAQITGVVPES
jgi:hypothetical protein